MPTDPLVGQSDALEALAALVEWIEGWRDQVDGGLEARWSAPFKETTPELRRAHEVIADAMGIPSADEMRTAMYENVAKGHARIVGETEDGQPIFEMTDEGKRHVEEDLLDGPDD